MSTYSFIHYKQEGYHIPDSTILERDRQILMKLHDDDTIQYEDSEYLIDLFFTRWSIFRCRPIVDIDGITTHISPLSEDYIISNIYVIRH